MPRKDPAPAEHFDAAIQAGNLDGAWEAACNMGRVRLDRALRLLILLGAEEEPTFERAARRFLTRLIKERSPTVEQIKKIADALNVLRYEVFEREDARYALEDLADQLTPGNKKGPRRKTRALSQGLRLKAAWEPIARRREVDSVQRKSPPPPRRRGAENWGCHGGTEASKTNRSRVQAPPAPLHRCAF